MSQPKWMLVSTAQVLEHAYNRGAPSTISPEAALAAIFSPLPTLTAREQSLLNRINNGSIVDDMWNSLEEAT